MYYNYRFLREADPPGGAGGADPKLPLSLSEIEARIKAKQEGKEPAAPANPGPAAKPDPKDPVDKGGIEGGDGSKKLPILDPNNPPAPEIPPGKKLDADGKTLIDDPDYKKPDGDAGDTGDDEPADEDPLSFWKSVDERTGLPVKVEYPEGIDPLSPEGVVLRETAVREQAVDNWEQALKQRYPRAYAYMMHHMEGGADADFLDPARGISLPDRTAVEGSIEMQTRLYKEDLLSKGLDPEVVEAQLASVVKKNQLAEKSLAIYDSRQKERQDELANIELRNKEENLRVDKVIKAITARVDKEIPNLNFIIPEARKEEFSKFVDDNIQYDKHSNKVYMVSELDMENPKAQLEALAFKFFGGDLNKIVERKVSTKAAQRLRQQADKTKTSNPKDQGGPSDKPTFVPLGQMGGFSKK